MLEVLYEGDSNDGGVGTRLGWVYLFSMMQEEDRRGSLPVHSPSYPLFIFLKTPKTPIHLKNRTRF
jgi:hypothetical protein